MHEYWANGEYAEFLCTEFVPAIDSQYRTKLKSPFESGGGSLTRRIDFALQCPCLSEGLFSSRGQSSAPHLAEAETTLELSVRGKSLSR
jgi:hypothetical protein